MQKETKVIFLFFFFNPKYFSTHKYYLKATRHPNNFFPQTFCPEWYSKKSSKVLLPMPLPVRPLVYNIRKSNCPFSFLSFFFNIKYFPTPYFIYIPVATRYPNNFFHKLCPKWYSNRRRLCAGLRPLVYTSEKPKICAEKVQNRFLASFFSTHIFYI